MRVTELLESLSRVVYHYTNLAAAAKILQTGEFELSSVTGSIEQKYAPKGMPFFLSTTRTRRGGYHDIVGSGGALFVLNGDWFNQHYVSKPVDYWENRDPTKGHHRAHEAEDRVFSKDPTIPAAGITEVHILSKSNGGMGVHARRALIAAKRRGISAYFYENETDWRNLNKARAIPIEDRPSLRGQEQFRWGANRRAYMRPWLELVRATDQKQLSKDADKLRYGIIYNDYNRREAAQGLANDLSNARKPNSGPDREIAVSLIRFMQQNRLNTLAELVEFLAKKWAPTQDTN